MKEIQKKNKHTAVILGMFETGLGVARSLGKNGIRVLGVDYKKDLGFYSRHVAAKKCPHPREKEEDFIRYLVQTGRDWYPDKPVLFITSDDFLLSLSRNRERLAKHYLLNLPDHSLTEQIADKYSQYLLAKRSGIPVPRTILLKPDDDIHSLKGKVGYPLFMKALEVQPWRERISRTVKGFLLQDFRDLEIHHSRLREHKIACIIQEVIEGPDTNHFKYSAYISGSGEILCDFTLQKIRQYPIHFGVGSMVKSVHHPELMKLGRTLFQKIGYRGVGSAEFKLDPVDSKLKLIELNPRYWQQNSLADFCGVNFPMIHYGDLTGLTVPQAPSQENGPVWVNIYLDTQSFLDYRKQGELSFRDWRKSYRGKKILSDWTLRDPLPGLSEIQFGLKLFKLPLFLFKKIFNSKSCEG